jgi:membrane protein required for colicin V production
MDVNIIEIIKELNITDWIIVSIFAISIIYGALRGFFKEMGALIIWIVAFVVAWTFYDQFSVMLKEHIPNDQIRTAASVIILILGVILVGSILNMFLSFLIGKAGLGGVDKIFGLFFGFVRAGLLVGIMAHMLTVLHLSNNSFISESFLMKKLAPYGEWIYDFVPEGMRNAIEGKESSGKSSIVKTAKQQSVEGIAMVTEGSDKISEGAVNAEQVPEIEVVDAADTDTQAETPLAGADEAAE